VILPLTVAFGSVAAGTALGLLRSDQSRAVTVLQALALIAAVVVGLVHLLPEALRALGPSALIAFALPLVLSLGTALATHEPERDRLGVELGYAALVVHRLADGVLLGAYGGLVHPAAAHADLLLALGLHAVPVSAAVALRFARHDGMGAALGRTGGMLVGSLAGVLLAEQIPIAAAQRIDPWASAAIAGLLVYLAWHEWRDLQRLNRSV
jgi:hypothetical protein